MEMQEGLAEQFEANRAHLQAVAYRMLGDLTEADDAVQEAWLHLSRSDTASVKNLSGWLRTVVARICLDMLRTRKSRREESLDASVYQPDSRPERHDPEREALLADAVGIALLVVLENLSPAERLAFVLHDIFDVPFDQIARVVERSETAARQLASRARKRVRGGAQLAETSQTYQREMVDAFLVAARAGNFEALLNILAPNVVLRHDLADVPVGEPGIIRGPRNVAGQFAGRAQDARAVLVNNSIGIIVAPGGKLLYIIRLQIEAGRITELELIANPTRQQEFELKILES